MKTKRSTKIMFALAGSLLAIGSMQAQQVNKDSLMNLNKNAIQQICPGQGHAAGASGFWGYAFGDYAYMTSGDSAGRGTKQQYKGLGQTNGSSSTQTQNHIPNQNAFEIRRAYLGYDYKINSKFSAYALLAYEGDQDVNDNRTVFLKYMYFKWKNIWKGTDLKVGQQATNSFASDYNTEPLMGYRASEKTIMDIHGMDGSSDMGLTLQGKIWTAKSSDSTKVPLFIGYSAMVGNNSGNNPVAGFTNSAATSLGGSSISSPSYTSTSTTTVPMVSQKTGKDTTINGISTYTVTTKTTTTGTSVSQSLNPFNVTSDRAKKFRANIFVNCLNTALTVGAYADYINYGNYYYGTAKGYQHSVMTEKVYATYNSKWFGIGGEFVMQTYKNGEIESFANVTDKTTLVVTKGAANDTTDASQTGISVFAHGTILPGCLNIFARYDMYTPDTKYSYNQVASGSSSSFSSNATEAFTSAMSNVSGSSTANWGSGNYYKESFLNVGLDWTPTKDKKIHLMPNVWYYSIKSPYGADSFASANYMLYRVTFLFAFN